MDPNNIVLTGRPAAFRWPGLEELAEQQINSVAGSIIPHTREEELALAKKEAGRREKEYGGEENKDAAPIEIDFSSLRLGPGPDGAHTTIDFGKFSDASGLATVTTSDFLVFNKIKRILFDDKSRTAANERGWSITDLKLNQTRTALFFITVQLPVGEIKRILNKF